MFAESAYIGEMAKYLAFKNRSKSSRTTSAYFRSKYFFERFAVLRVRDFPAFGGAFGSTVSLRLIPAEALSRVGAFNMVGAFAFGPVAFAAAGPVAAALGARAVLAFGAAWSVATTLAVLTVPAIRHQPWPDPQQPAPAPAD
jgi:hypothetical protein